MKNLNEKALLITGEAPTGKSLLAKMIATYFKSPLFLSAKNLNPDEPVRWGEAPDVIIIDDIKAKDLEKTYNWISEGVFIKKLYQDVFKVHPKIIVTSGDPKIKDCFIGASFFERFHVIELAQPAQEVITYYRQ